MAKVRWTDQALEDLEAVCLFIDRDAPRYGELFADRAFAAVERLGDLPLSGRIVPEIGRKDIREIIFGKYRIIYRVLPDEVEILTVYHGARRLNSFKP
ncbi:MAG: Toxin RelE4 [Dehalococcoidia bacterium]|nr:Toxin RelE4 [Chloroflexota bacterium]